ncbi:MAG: hypothetical protein HYR60_11045 [Acidobacteria bacterium]|nr:hypothetical protein [Acidobacteriota bacterium]
MKTLLTLISICAAAFAANGALKNPAQPVLWSGAVTAGSGPTSEVPECAPGCQRFDLTVDLPPGAWNNKPGGLQVAIRFGGAIFDNLRLFVYRGGALIAKSDGIISTAQSVLIREGQDGVYQVYVAYDPDSPSAAVAYEGLAEVEYDPKPHPARRLLPDLAVRPQRNLSFDPVGIFFDNISAQYPTCYESEVQEEGARLCLRFDQTLANTGEGPMELRFAIPSGLPAPPVTNAYQRLYWSDSPAHFEERLAGQMEFHQAHGHYHFKSFGLSSLWSVDNAGNFAGSAPLRQHHGVRPVGAHLTRTGRKVSFCLADVMIDAWARKGDGPRTYNAPDCLDPAFTQGGYDHFVQGINRGWADVYDWYLPDQYIDISGVADGVYILQTIADPDGRLVEADKSNNCGSVYIRLSNLASNTPAAQLLGPGPGCKGMTP